MSLAKPMFQSAAVTIACTDLPRSIQFYEKILGAVVEPGDGYGCRWYKLGTLSINLLPNAIEPSPARMPNHPMAMLWLVTENLGAVAQWFTESEVNVLQPSDGQFMMISDPDGVIIEVWQADEEEVRA